MQTAVNRGHPAHESCFGSSVLHTAPSSSPALTFSGVDSVVPVKLWQTGPVFALAAAVAPAEVTHCMGQRARSCKQYRWPHTVKM